MNSKKSKGHMKKNTTKRAIQIDNKLEYVTKVHLERIPLQNLPIKCIKMNDLVDKEKQTEKATKMNKSPKKRVFSNKEYNNKENIQNSANRNVAGNSNNTLKTPIYKQFEIDPGNKYRDDEYDFIVSPTNIKYKVKRKRKNNRAQTPASLSFHVFDIPKFTKTKPKRRRRFPRIVQAILTVNSKKQKKGDLYCNSNFHNNNFTSTLKNNVKEPIVQKRLNKVDEVMADIKNKIKKKEESKKPGTPPNIEVQHDHEDYDSEGIANNEDYDSEGIANNEDYDSEGINSKEDDVHVVEPIIKENESEKYDKTVEEDILACFGFDDDDKFSPKETNTEKKSNNISKRHSSTNRTPNNKITILSDILIQPSPLPDKTINENSHSLLYITNSTLNDTKNLQSKVHSLQNTINDSLSFNHLSKKGPGANSTMIWPHNNEKSFSWRLDEHLFRYNPHFLMLKQSCLPATDQESIIDHTFDDSICQNAKKSVHNNNDDKNTEKPFVQKSILDFIESSEKRDIAPELKRISLFNIDELSPLKESQQQNLPERNPENVKRNIFNKISPKKNSPSNKENMNVNDKVCSKKLNKENSPTKQSSFSSFDKEKDIKENSFPKNENSKSLVTEKLLPVVVLKRLDLTEPALKRVGLFNMDELIPLKESQQQNLPEKNPGNVKRNIFNGISPKKNSPSNKENVNVNDKVRLKKRNKENRPTKQSSFSSFDKENDKNEKSFSENENSKISVTEKLSPVVLFKSLNLTEPELKSVSLFNIDELSPLKESQQQNLPEKNPGNVKRNIFNKISPKKNSPSNKENVNVNDNVRSKKRNKENSTTKLSSLNSFDEENNKKGNSFSKNENSKMLVTEKLSPVVLLKRLDLTLIRERKLNLTDDFGFDSLLIDDEMLKDHDKKQVPTRISLREIKRVLIKNNSDEEKIKVVPENSPNKILNDSDSDNDTPVVNSPDEFPNDKINVGLFEDLKLEPKASAKKYERKVPSKRKRRFYSKDSDAEHSVVSAPKKKKKKDVMSHEEEEEFEKWAAAFNSECKEVDKFHLEIV